MQRRRKRGNEKIFGEGKYSFSGEERKNREGKGGKYLERENILFAEEKKNGKEKEENISGRKRRKLLDKEKKLPRRGKRMKKF